MSINSPPRKDSTPNSELRPKCVQQAIIGMWLSFFIGQTFNIYQAMDTDSGVDWYALTFSVFILAATVVVYMQVSAGREWARKSYLLMLVLSYSLMALDDGGVSDMDLISICITAPIDIFVLVRLFSVPSARWFMRGNG